MLHIFIVIVCFWMGTIPWPEKSMAANAMAVKQRTSIMDSFRFHCRKSVIWCGVGSWSCSNEVH